MRKISVSGLGSAIEMACEKMADADVARRFGPDNTDHADAHHYFRERYEQWLLKAGVSDEVLTLAAKFLNAWYAD